MLFKCNRLEEVAIYCDVNKTKFLRPRLRPERKDLDLDQDHNLCNLLMYVVNFSTKHFFVYSKCSKFSTSLHILSQPSLSKMCDNFINCCFMVASSMGLYLSGNREINRRRMMMVVMVMDLRSPVSSALRLSVQSPHVSCCISVAVFVKF